MILLGGIALIFSGCSGCYYRSGARVTPAFSASRGMRVYIHPPRDKTLVAKMGPLVADEIHRLGFVPVDEPGESELIAYYYFDYDRQEPTYIRDFLVVFKPYPGDRSELLASASCNHPCSSTSLDRSNSGAEVHKAFAALRAKLKPAPCGCN
jgi:hypothetical protein